MRNPLLADKCRMIAYNALYGGNWDAFENIVIRTSVYNAQETFHEKEYMAHLAKSCIDTLEERRVS